VEELNVVYSNDAVPIDVVFVVFLLMAYGGVIWITFQVPARSIYIVTPSMLALFRLRSMSDYLLVLINDDSADTFCSG
jgi:hypothetical protein